MRTNLAQAIRCKSDNRVGTEEYHVHDSQDLSQDHGSDCE